MSFKKKLKKIFSSESPPLPLYNNNNHHNHHNHHNHNEELVISAPISKNDEPKRACPICSELFPSSQIEKHAAECGNEAFTPIIPNNNAIQPHPPPQPHPHPPINNSSPNHNTPPLVENYEEIIDKVDDFEFSVENPFEFKCPYTTCDERMEVFKFPEHVFNKHIDDDDQRHICPLCALSSEETPPVTESLIIHLQDAHSDFKPELNLSSSIGIPLSLGTGSIEETLSENITNAECSICFEEFFSGQVISRLECWCIFHKVCIEDWYTTSGHRSCPVHKQHETQK